MFFFNGLLVFHLLLVKNLMRHKKYQYHALQIFLFYIYAFSVYIFFYSFPDFILFLKKNTAAYAAI